VPTAVTTEEPSVYSNQSALISSEGGNTQRIGLYWCHGVLTSIDIPIVRAAWGGMRITVSQTANPDFTIRKLM